MQEAWNEERRHAIDQRWIEQLRANLPIGVPLADRGGPWPQTFRSEYQEVAENEDDCTQCMFCRYYAQLEGPLGYDWGGCLKEGGQYDRQLVFEHWTCCDFEYAPDSQDFHTDWLRLALSAAEEFEADEAFYASIGKLPPDQQVERIRERLRQNAERRQSHSPKT
ncbi:MAG: hypothetical protein KGJ86_00975 [Chloroflexota bacterium]|nr:hypothetical protein [Chloroflexota bacterium]